MHGSEIFLPRLVRALEHLNLISNLHLGFPTIGFETKFVPHVSSVHSVPKKMTCLFCFCFLGFSGEGPQ